jgi:glutamate racemase
VDKPIVLIDTGEAVARQLGRLLLQHGLQNDAANQGSVLAFTTGSVDAAEHAFSALLGRRTPVEAAAI